MIGPLESKVAFRGMKTYNEGKLELQNLQILEETLCSLLCPETDWHICESKVLILRNDVLIYYSWHQFLSTIIWRLRVFINKLMS